MSTEPEPMRWLDPASEVPPELRFALADAASERPSPEALARIQAGVLAKIALAAKLGLVVKIVLGLLVAGGAAFLSTSPPSPPLSTPAPPLPRVAPAVVPIPEVTPATEPATIPEPARPPTPKRPERAKPPSPPRVDATPVPDEIDLLESAQRALSGDPKETLRLTTLSEKHYPGGDFIPEREALAINALLQLDRRPEAEARFSRLRSSHPNAAVLRRLEELLGSAR